MLVAVGDFTYFYLDIWIIMDYPKCYIEVFTGDFGVFKISTNFIEVCNFKKRVYSA